MAAMSYWTDALFVAAGIPTVDYGPGAHEGVECGDLKLADQQSITRASMPDRLSATAGLQ